MERSITVQLVSFTTLGILHSFAWYLARPSVSPQVQRHTQHLSSSGQLRQIHVHDPLLHDTQLVPFRPQSEVQGDLYRFRVDQRSLLQLLGRDHGLEFVGPSRKASILAANTCL